MRVPVFSAPEVFRVRNVVCATVLIFCFSGCNKDAAKTETPANASPQPSATAAQPATPAGPTRPVPSFSAAQKVGLYAYPAKSQGKDQQLIDESDCYDSAQQQTGVNPEMGAPQAPSSADVQAAQAQAAESAPQAKGGRAKGAARGAVGGAVVGGIAGDAGTGAAVGATVGTVKGGRQQRKGNEAAKQQASDQAGAQMQQEHQNQMAAHNQELDKFKRSFSACMTARGYSIQ